MYLKRPAVGLCGARRPETAERFSKFLLENSICSSLANKYVYAVNNKHMNMQNDQLYIY